MNLHYLPAGTLIPLFARPLAAICEVSVIAQSSADYAVGKYEAEMTETLPYPVSFGPSTLGGKYNGPSERDFLTEEQLRLDPEMYPAMMLEIAN